MEMEGGWRGKAWKSLANIMKNRSIFFSVVFDDFANHQIRLSLKRFPPNPLPKEVEGSSNSLFGY